METLVCPSHRTSQQDAAKKAFGTLPMAVWGGLRQTGRLGSGAIPPSIHRQIETSDPEGWIHPSLGTQHSTAAATNNNLRSR